MNDRLERNLSCCVLPLSSSGAVLLTIVFFIAKIMDKIDWSWWWVFSPLWIPIILSVFISILLVLLWFIIFLYDNCLRKKKL